jgi:hypothetical protein
MSLSFLFFLFFGETMYADEGSMSVGRSVAYLAASGLTDAETGARGGALAFFKLQRNLLAG